MVIQSIFNNCSSDDLNSRPWFQ